WSLTRTLEQTLHGPRTLAADKIVELSHNPAADAVRVEDHAGHRGRHEEDWRDRKQRVVGERRPEPERIVVPPGPERGPEHGQNRRCAHAVTLPQESRHPA